VSNPSDELIEQAAYVLFEGDTGWGRVGWSDWLREENREFWRAQARGVAVIFANSALRDRVCFRVGDLSIVEGLMTVEPRVREVVRRHLVHRSLADRLCEDELVARLTEIIQEGQKR
jgi:hypothetical protein